MTPPVERTDSFEEPKTSNSFDDWERPDPIVVDKYAGPKGGNVIVYRCNYCGDKNEGYASTGQIYFCDRSCYMTYRNLVVNPSYKHGRHWSRKRRLAMEAVLERGYDDFEHCERCSAFIERPRLRNFHHLDGDPWNNEPDNVEFWCTPCHLEFHSHHRDRDEKGRYVSYDAAD